MNFSEELTPKDMRNVIRKLGIKLNGKQANSDGWITINSPLRKDNNPSFELNLLTGAYHDHGNGNKGDIVNLVEQIRDISNAEAIQWIKDQLNFIDGFSNQILGETVQIQGPKAQHSKSFWTTERTLTLSEAQVRLLKEDEHTLLQHAQNYDQIGAATLQYFGCGILEQYGKDWLTFPYETGCQLYRRENGKKVIRALKGSAPSETFFGIRKITDNRRGLFIAKSPRETMLPHQLYGSKADVLGLATGEQAMLSKGQIE